MKARSFDITLLKNKDKFFFIKTGEESPHTNDQQTAAVYN